jgi:hypothetical protein
MTDVRDLRGECLAAIPEGGGDEREDARSNGLSVAGLAVLLEHVDAAV